MDYNFEICKNCSARAGELRYRLREVNLWVCSECGSHYIDYLDPIESIEPTVRPDALTEEGRAYFENIQHSNSQRSLNHVEWVRQHRNLDRLQVLDVGCGGGMFLSLLRKAGAETCGVELDDSAVQYARENSDPNVHKYPVEHDFWQSRHRERFDVVTFWDVVEHVNFPLESLRSATRLLKPGGLLFIDTPCRETFYHRFGSLTYRLSRGRYPTFLNMMYSSAPFAHKQILGREDLERMLDRIGLEIINFKKIHELSCPCDHYLKKLFRSRTVATISQPFARTFLAVIRIRNKMVVVAKKSTA